MSCLSDSQKAALARLATRAYMFSAAKERGQGRTPDMSYRAIDEWRHAQVVAACGKLGLRCCSQEDYGAVKAHFLHLLGEDGQALKVLVRDDGNERRQWEHKLLAKLREMNKPATYAAAICRQMFHGANILDASAEQLRKIYFALVYQQKRNERKTAA